MTQRSKLKLTLESTTSLLSLPIGAAMLLLPNTAAAQFNDDEIIVTATKRSESIQDVPINIAAIGGAQIEELGVGDLSELMAYVPGVSIVDQGGRDGNQIIVRGLSADPIGGGFGQADGGGTVSPYIGEVPLFIDLRLNDLERVEVLLGPQGTLYGKGTMGGAIRYIPNKPNFSGEEFEIRAGAYTYKEGSGVSTDVGFTFNAPLSDTFAIRGSLDYLNDEGFIDTPFIVAQPGVSNPEDPADFTPLKDQNTEDIFSGRVAARWEPTDYLDATLTYYFQQAKNGGRNESGRLGPLATGEYEAPTRVREPNERDNELLALEVIADLGFAELTSATGFAKTSENGQRDQTDLLISLEYSYEFFPNFTAFTFEEDESKIFNQEVRLVSTGDKRYNWIVGAFYNKNEYRGLSSEFTPEYIDVYFGAPLPSTGDLEYFAAARSELEEKAIFGEVGFDITENWDITVGGRYYDYSFLTGDATDFPVADYLFFGVASEDLIDPYRLSEIDDNISLEPNQDFSGELFKVNTSYKFGGGNMAYATFSQGYRTGAANAGVPCTGNYLTDPNQALCLLDTGQQFSNNPGDVIEISELGYFPDTVNNYEIGAKTTWLDGALILNGAVFYMDWGRPQVSSTNVFAGTSITVNAGAAKTQGVELSSSWDITDQFNLRGSFNYTKAELTEGVGSLIGTITPPGFDSAFIDGEAGDRLPGSPETQFSIFGSYDHPLNNGNSVILNGGYAWQSDVLSRTGGRGSSYTLPSYGRANVSAGYHADNWNFTVYADNLFNDFSESSVTSTSLFNQTVANHRVRSHTTNVLPPRSVGARFKYKFK